MTPTSKDPRLRDQYYTIAELASELGLTVRTIERWGRQGVGPPRMKLAGKWVLYKKSSVAEWLAAAETATMGSS